MILSLLPHFCLFSFFSHLLPWEMADPNAVPYGAVPLFSQLPPISVKLTDGNFLMWQQQVDVAVYGYGLEGFLTGEATAPPQMVPDAEEGTLVMNPAFLAWQRQDRRVAGWLLSSLSEGALTLVVGLRSARDIWCALETNFASRSTAKVMQ